MCFAKRAVLSLRVLLSLCCAGLSLSISAVGIIVLGLYVLTCITLHELTKISVKGNSNSGPSRLQIATIFIRIEAIALLCTLLLSNFHLDNFPF